MEFITCSLPSQEKLSRLIQKKGILNTLVLAGVGLVLFRKIRKDYTKWHGLGQGGVPHNLYGYMLSLILTQLGDEDVTSTAIYTREAEASALERTTFLVGPVHMRFGPKPDISKWAAPVRQLSAMSPESVKQKLYSVLYDYPNFSYTKVCKSTIERGTHCANSLHIIDGHAEPARRFATRGPNELYHIHPSDGSAHAVVSAADAKILIEAGWSERHLLSGAAIGGFPTTYIMIYAPRADEEIAIHEMVIRAATNYATMKAAMHLQ